MTSAIRSMNDMGWSILSATLGRAVRFAKWHRIPVTVRRLETEFARLEKLPRYQPTTTSLLGLPLEVPDGYSVTGLYKEIFQKEIYRFTSSRPEPYIIDGGANSGLSVIYFRKLHPRSRILAFEPDPLIFRILQKNLATFACDNVQALPYALWSSERDLQFFHEGGVGGRVSRPGDPSQNSVRAVRLREYLSEPVDFLKLDIEGAETEVLEDCADRLHHVKNIFVEYHSFAGEKQTLARLLTVLDKAGFRVHVHTSSPTPRPYVERRLDLGIDLLMNIFGFRG